MGRSDGKDKCSGAMRHDSFYAHNEDATSYNWWEVCCFPYLLLTRVWDFFITLCGGSNQCLIYWMVVQWLVCKITRITTPDPLLFPYYFYVFGQVFFLTFLCGMFWHYFGKSIVVPYFISYYAAIVAERKDVDMNIFDSKNEAGERRVNFRKYCFRKSEIFDTHSADFNSADLGIAFNSFNLVTVALDLFVYNLFY